MNGKEKITLVGNYQTGHLAAEHKHPHPRKVMLGGMGVNYLIEFLQFLQLEHRAAQVYRGSPYELKSATLKLIKWSLERGFISRREQYKSKFRNRKRPMVFYRITDSGRELLRMIS